MRGCGDRVRHGQEKGTATTRPPHSLGHRGVGALVAFMDNKRAPSGAKRKEPAMGSVSAGRDLVNVLTLVS